MWSFAITHWVFVGLGTPEKRVGSTTTSELKGPASLFSIPLAGQGLLLASTSLPQSPLL